MSEMTLTPVCEDYLGLLDSADSATSTYSNNRRSFELYAEFLATRGIDEQAVSLAHMREFLKELIGRYKPATAAHHIINVRAAYKHAYETGAIPTNPTSGIQKMIPKGVDKLPEVLTSQQLRACHARLQTGRERIIFYLLLFTGCRAAEIRPLRWYPGDHSYVDFDNDQLVIYGKNSKIRFVPLHPILRSELEQWQTNPERGSVCVVESKWHREMSHQTWTREVTAIFERAGVEFQMKSHVFRKTLNTNLLRQDVPEHVLDALFGWAPATVRTKHYSGVARDEVRDAILKAYSDDPVVPEQRTGVVEEAMIARLQAEIARLKGLKHARV